jgi:hypothetical protein
MLDASPRLIPGSWLLDFIDRPFVPPGSSAGFQSRIKANGGTARVGVGYNLGNNAPVNKRYSSSPNTSPAAH